MKNNISLLMIYAEKTQRWSRIELGKENKNVIQTYKNYFYRFHCKGNSPAKLQGSADHSLKPLI